MDKITAEEEAEFAALVGSPPGITAADLGEWLGLTAARVNALARDGKLPRRGDGTFDLKLAVRAYVESIRTRGSTLAANPELNAQKIRLARANAAKVEMQNQRAAGELLAAAEVEREWADMLRTVRAGVLSLPGRIGQRVGKTSPADLAAITDECRAVLGELADE
ncbi:MAG: hypothetical protein CL814_00900 [Confluentimicrobium sp.]|uniref:hypothetical protein n=1 Tax=Actibacterium sp. TaxID=1872125 RepID=UPI000C3DA091|nr:hypothetical protein [Actibacterium sp.]MBC55478.1 hypothetical protein [Actibacterium sp.]|tara:strand:- start:6083 stop:6577 length:495 start_codon:yes stop_codon:yes gene_type:complete